MRTTQLERTLIAVIVILLLTACNLFSPSASEPEIVVEELPVVEAPEPVEEPDPDVEPEFTPEQVLRFDFEDTVHSVAYANAGDRVATGTYQKVDIWDTGAGSLVQSLEDLPHSVVGVAFAPDDQAVFAAFALGGVNRYTSGDNEPTIDFHGGYDTVLALSPDGTRIASGNRDGLTWLWDASSGELIHELDPANHIADYSEFMTSQAFSPDGSIIAAGHWNGYIFLWDANSGSLIRYIEPETDFCSAVGLTFSDDGQYLAVGGHKQEFDDVIKVFRVADGSLAWVLNQYSRSGSMAAPVAFSPDGTRLAAGAMDGIYIWALPDYQLLHTIPIEDTGDVDWVTDLAFSPDSQFLLAGYWNQSAVVWQVQE